MVRLFWGKNEWWQVDLGKSEKISNIRIHWEKQDAAYQYKVESSLDQKQWTTVVDSSANNKNKESSPIQSILMKPDI